MYEVTRKFIKNKYEELKKESKDYGKEEIKLSFWHHFNNMLVSLEKFLKSVPVTRDEIYKSEKKDLKEILNKYLKDTSKDPDHIRYKKVREFIEIIDNDLKIHKNEKDIFDIKDKKIKYGLFNSKTKIAKPLFPDPSGRPVLKDVKQGYTDLDCYFLAVLISIVNKNPKVIIDCFPDYPKNGNEKEIEEFNASKKIKVRFYKINPYSRNPDGTTVNIILDKTSLRSGGAPWVRILEKAFAVYRAKGYDTRTKIKNVNSKKVNSRIIDEGEESVVMLAITGKKYNSIKFSQDNAFGGKRVFGNYDAEANGLFNKIKKALAHGKVVTACTKGRRILWFSVSHAYSVLNVEEKNGIKYITVVNPYKGRIRVYDKNNKIKHVTPKDKSKRGISQLELNDFMECFDGITVSDDISEV